MSKLLSLKRSLLKVISFVILFMGIGGLAGCDQGEGTQQVDAEGKTIIPGFNDAHLHALFIPPTAAKLGAAKSKGEIVFFEKALTNGITSYGDALVPAELAIACLGAQPVYLMNMRTVPVTSATPPNALKLS